MNVINNVGPHVGPLIPEFRDQHISLLPVILFLYFIDVFNLQPCTYGHQGLINLHVITGVDEVIVM